MGTCGGLISRAESFCNNEANTDLIIQDLNVCY